MQFWQKLGKKLGWHSSPLGSPGSVTDVFAWNKEVLFCRGHEQVWIGAMREYIFSDGSTFDYHEFTYKTITKNGADCMYVNTAENQVISEYCNQNRQYICQSLQYVGKNSIKSILLSLCNYYETGNNWFRGLGHCSCFLISLHPPRLWVPCYNLTEVFLKLSKI